MRECIEEVWLPQCLAIGIDYNTFWTLNPKRVKPFLKVFKQKKEEEIATINLTAWLNGRYVADAINACFGKNHKYPDKPIDLTAKENNALSPAERFGAIVATWNAQFESNEQNDMEQL